MVRVLHLTLLKKWFDLIAKGIKKEEYREVKPYWDVRLNKEFDEIHFTQGYGKSRPFMRVEYKGKRMAIFEGKRCYALKFGKILEISNYNSK